jgi:hypothetical protein
MTARTPDSGMVLPRDTAGATVRGTLAAALERVRGWWVRHARPVRAHLWEVAVDGTIAFRPGSMGLALTCRAGTFLVTQEGDPVDHVLEAGDSFRTSSCGRVAAWALCPDALASLQGPRLKPETVWSIEGMVVVERDQGLRDVAEPRPAPGVLPHGPLPGPLWVARLVF